MSEAIQKEKIDKPYREMSAEEILIAVEENKWIIHENMDFEYMKGLCSELIEPLNLYFRPKLIGFDEMPERNNPERPIIYAQNHSGMAFPWDAVMFGSNLLVKHDFDFHKTLRPLSAPALSATTLMNPFMIKNFWKRIGAIDAYGLNFETMMHQQETNVLIYPEGIPGIGKGFGNKYKLQTFSTSMVRMAIKYRTDIIWVSCINGEYINPWAYRSKFLNRIANSMGIPYLPLGPILPILILQPWAFYSGWPAQLNFVRGKRFKPYDMTGGKSWEELDTEDFKRIRDEIQVEAQGCIDEALEKYGQAPFQMKSFWKNIKSNWRSLLYWTPPGWPSLFLEFDRRYRKEGKVPKNVTKGWFKFWYILFKNPIIIAYFIPIIGWIPILIQGMRGRKKVKLWEPGK